MHSGGKASVGGFGCGAQETRCSAPGEIVPTVWVVPPPVSPGGWSVLPLLAGTITLIWSKAQKLPPPAWQPKGAGPLLNVLSSECPVIMSPIEVRIGARTSRSPRLESLVSVKTPAEPPLTVQAPGASGG